MIFVSPARKPKAQLCSDSLSFQVIVKSKTWPDCWLSSWWSGCRILQVCRHAERSSLAGYWQLQDSNERHPGSKQSMLYNKIHPISHEQRWYMVCTNASDGKFIWFLRTWYVYNTQKQEPSRTTLLHGSAKFAAEAALAVSKSVPLAPITHIILFVYYIYIYIWLYMPVSKKQYRNIQQHVFYTTDTCCAPGSRPMPASLVPTSAKRRSARDTDRLPASVRSEVHLQ